MSIHDLQIGDKLQVLVGKSTRGIYTLNDIIEITHIRKDINNTLWILHTPNSFSGGGFRICNDDNNRSSYKLGIDVVLISKKECYKYLIKLFRKLNIK